MTDFHVIIFKLSFFHKKFIWFSFFLTLSWRNKGKRHGHKTWQKVIWLIQSSKYKSRMKPSSVYYTLYVKGRCGMEFEKRSAMLKHKRASKHVVPKGKNKEKWILNIKIGFLIVSEVLVYFCFLKYLNNMYMLCLLHFICWILSLYYSI